MKCTDIWVLIYLQPDRSFVGGVLSGVANSSSWPVSTYLEEDFKVAVDTVRGLEVLLGGLGVLSILDARISWSGNVGCLHCYVGMSRFMCIQ